MEKRPNQRSWKNYLIRRDIQLPIVAANLMFLGIVIAIFIVVLLSPLYVDLLTSDEVWVQQVSGNLFLILLERVVIALALTLVLAVVHQIIFSHRFCGPLVNFGRTFEKMAQCDFSRRVLLRRKDFLKPEAERVNAVLDRVNAEGRVLQANMQHVTAVIEQLKGTALPREAAGLVAELSESSAACRRSLAAWVLTKEK